MTKRLNLIIIYFSIIMGLFFIITISKPKEMIVIHVDSQTFDNNPMKPKNIKKDNTINEKINLILSDTNNDTKVTQEEVVHNTYSEEDVELLANLMYIEVEQYINDKKAEYVYKLVGSVVIHRMQSKYYADTLSDVIWDNTQYAQSTLDKIYKKDIPEKVYVWAEELLKYGPIGPENLVYQSEFKQGKEIYYQYGNQYFCLM